MQGTPGAAQCKHFHPGEVRAVGHSAFYRAFVCLFQANRVLCKTLLCSAQPQPGQPASPSLLMGINTLLEIIKLCMSMLLKALKGAAGGV